MAAARRWLVIMDVRSRNFRARAGSPAMARNSSRFRLRTSGSLLPAASCWRSTAPARIQRPPCGAGGRKVEQAVGAPLEQNARELVGQIDRVLDAAVQSHAADRIVDVGGVAGEQHAALAEGCGDTLMRHVEIAVDDLVGDAAPGRTSAAAPAPPSSLVRSSSACRRIGRENRAPQAGRAVGRNLEAIAPCAGVGEIAAVGNSRGAPRNRTAS